MSLEVVIGGRSRGSGAASRGSGVVEEVPQGRWRFSGGGCRFEG